MWAERARQARFDAENWSTSTPGLARLRAIDAERMEYLAREARRGEGEPLPYLGVTSAAQAARIARFNFGKLK